MRDWRVDRSARFDERMSDPDERLRDWEQGDADRPSLDAATQWVPEPVADDALPEDDTDTDSDDAHDELGEEIDRAGS